MTSSKLPACACVLVVLLSATAGAAEFLLRTSDVLWQQAGQKASFVIFPEREEFSGLDKVGRFIIALEIGTGTDPRRPAPAGTPAPDPEKELAACAVQWEARFGDKVLAARTQPIPKGMVDVLFSAQGLPPGRYDLSAKLLKGGQPAQEARSFFRVIEEPRPPQTGRVALVLPRGAPPAQGAWPVHGGIPFPKGALWSEKNVRVVDSQGRETPARAVVRSRWGCTPEASIRWLGLDFQAANAPAWWPERKDVRYYLEYGPAVSSTAAPAAVQIRETPQGLAVDNGAMQFLVRRKGFNLLDDVRIGGRPGMTSSPRHGLYIVDHEGTVYRAANDAETTLTVEEQTDLRAVIRAEGWYVRDGSDGRNRSFTLPTDRISKFVARIEVYAGQPYVRLLNTWVLTFDPFTVRLRDVGFSLPLEGATQAEFGVEGAAPLTQAVPASGVYLIQHLPHAFAVEDGAGASLARGKHSAGWVAARTKNGVLAVGHRETWQRFPKEMEVLPDAVRFHLWPAHGRTHPEINPIKHEEIHKLWFCHQGRELNLAQPMDYYYATAAIADNPSTGIYKPGGTAMGGVFSSAMGTAITSDCLIHFAAAPEGARAVAEAFQSAPHVLADPAWTCSTRAAGILHPYDPERFARVEQEIVDWTRGYWETQDATGEYGMWLYRPWHHNTYLGNGKWDLYRLYNATHHYEAYMPWMLYARSGDPFYLTQGAANIRILTDLQIVHYNDPAYTHREYYNGQARLPGAVKHTNGFNLWGGDHCVLGHPTCYNGVILAHYLTGDLRLREVLVEEWQKTLVSDRLNPEFAGAERSANPPEGINTAREKNNALGELLDLYQFTHHPAVLGYVPQRLDHFLNTFIRPWGMPQHNVILHYGSEQARRQIIEAVEERMGPQEQFKDPKRAWFTHSPHENYALALALKPERRDMTFAAYLAVRRGGPAARAFREQKPRAEAFCEVPDRVNFLPRVLYALANARSTLAMDDLDRLTRAPHQGKNDRQGLRCIVREDKDQAFEITLYGVIQPGGFPLTVFGPDNQPVVTAQVPGGHQCPFVITVPKDGKTGEYVFFIRQPGHGSAPFLPFTRLPGEVYQTLTWSQSESASFFFRVPEGGARSFECTGPAHDFNRFALSRLNGEQIAESAFTPELDKAGKPTGRTLPLLKADVPPEGAWLTAGDRATLYVRTPIIFSISPDRWFQPAPDKLALKNPAPVKP